MRKFLILAILFAFLGCSTQKVFAPPETQEKTVYKEIERVDTVFQNVYKYIHEKGDTVFVRDSVILYRYKHVTRCDTFVQVDSIPYPVEVTKEVRVRNAYDRFTARGFWIYTAIILAGLIFLVVRWYIKRRFPS
jgi:hypothetical protein